tara:strand:+ start:316 stop:651 length:336 start_codon:yes stop_codon:yes gene_type:complete
MAKLHEITDQNFEKEVIQSKKNWSVTFSGLTFCAPCKVHHKMLESEILKDDISKTVNFGTVAVEDKGINISGREGIRSVPHTILYRNGEAVAQQTGSVPASEFLAFLKKHF